MALTQRYIEVNGVLIPQERPTMIGFGCPKCDDSELCSVVGNTEMAPPNIIRFLRKHRNCKVMLETLETRKDGITYVTGHLDPTKPSQIVKF
jgi:hypothetical protein